jgi:hypothetical protein
MGTHCAHQIYPGSGRPRYPWPVRRVRRADGNPAKRGTIEMEGLRHGTCTEGSRVSSNPIWTDRTSHQLGDDTDGAEKGVGQLMALAQIFGIVVREPDDAAQVFEDEHPKG